MLLLRILILLFLVLVACGKMTRVEIDIKTRIQTQCSSLPTYQRAECERRNHELAERALEKLEERDDERGNNNNRNVKA